MVVVVPTLITVEAIINATITTRYFLFSRLISSEIAVKRALSSLAASEIGCVSVIRFLPRLNYKGFQPINRSL
jgi:hypothetical protein